MQSILSKILATDTPGRGMGCLFVSTNTDLYPVSVSVVLRALKCHIGSCYKGTRLYLGWELRWLMMDFKITLSCGQFPWQKDSLCGHSLRNMTGCLYDLLHRIGEMVHTILDKIASGNGWSYNAPFCRHFQICIFLNQQFCRSKRILLKYMI